MPDDTVDILALFESLTANALQWIEQNVLVLSNAVQAVVVVLVLIVARILGPRLRDMLRARVSDRKRSPWLGLLTRIAVHAVPVLWLLGLWSALVVATQAGWPHHIIQIAASLTSAWVVIRIATGLIKNPAWSKFIAWIAWTLAALSTLGLFEATVGLLDGLAITLGTTRVSALTVIKGVLALAVLMWVAFGASNVLESRINRAPNLTPSVQVLFGKLIKIVLLTIAFLIAIDSVGVDLTTFAVFGGALGVGIGFGLQKIVSNLVSGVILLLDNSIKPGDVVTVGDTYGWIASLGARYAAVRTRDGIEHLIPNEELIIQRVENWSHSDKAVRFKVPVGIHYKSDVRLAMELCLDAAAQVSRILKDPEPRCLLKGFGDSSVDLELRIWIDDPANGRANVISEVLLGVWDRFQEHGVEIPYPQRDLHLRTSAVTLGGVGS